MAMLNVGQLRKALDGLPDDRLVVMSRDSEGNGYAQLARVELDNLHDGSPYGGEIYDLAWEEEGEEPPPASWVPCVTLWPAN